MNFDYLVTILLPMFVFGTVITTYIIIHLEKTCGGIHHDLFLVKKPVTKNVKHNLISSKEKELTEENAFLREQLESYRNYRQKG